MKVYLIASLAVTLSLTSCGKGDDNNIIIDPTANTWTEGTAIHTIKSYSTASQTIYAYDINGDGIAFAFNTLPAADGNYNVVHALTPGAQEVSVITFSGGSVPNTTYYATGTDHTIATIKMANGKPAITLPKTWVKKASIPDSVQITANLSRF